MIRLIVLQQKFQKSNKFEFCRPFIIAFWDIWCKDIDTKTVTLKNRPVQREGLNGQGFSHEPEKMPKYLFSKELMFGPYSHSNKLFPKKVEKIPFFRQHIQICKN